MASGVHGAKAAAAKSFPQLPAAIDNLGLATVERRAATTVTVSIMVVNAVAASRTAGRVDKFGEHTFVSWCVALLGTG